MPKLSKEAWTAAFFDVMKEPMPASQADLRRVGLKLEAEKTEAAQALKAAKAKAGEAQGLADDREQKRQGAAHTYDEERRATFTEEGRRSARQDYAGAVETAREAAEAAARARVALKEQEYRVKQLDDRLADIARRAESGDLAALGPALEQELKHALLAKRLEAEEAIIRDYLDRKRLREDELATARRDYREGEAFILEGDVKAFEERIEAARARCDAMASLLPGFTLEEAEPSNTDKLAATVARLKGATKAADAALAAERDKREGAEQARKTQDDAVEAAAGRDPILGAAFTLLAGKRQALTAAEEEAAADKEDVATATEKYRDWQVTLDNYASGREPQPTEQEIGDAMNVAGNRVGSLARDKAGLRGKQEAVRVAAAEVAAARKALGEAIESRLPDMPADGELALAQKALLEADAALRRAAISEKDAGDAAQQVHQLAGEAKRRLQHAKSLPAATATVGEFNEALKGVEDFPIWDGSTQLREKVGEQRFDQLVLLSRKLINDYQALVDSGATMEEQQAIYKNTPELWLPPRFREEEKNWVAMKGLVEEETEDKYRKESDTRLAAVDKKIEAYKSKLETGESVSGMLAKGLANAEMLKYLGSEKLTELGKQMSENKEFAEKAEQVLGLAAKLATMMQAPVKAIDSAQKSMETEDPIEMLMLQDEFMASLGSMVGALTGSIKGMGDLSIGGALVKEMVGMLPAIGIVTGAVDVMKGLVDSAARIQETMEDADSHTEAVDGIHRGETAIDQFARRDKHLAARAASKTGVAMIKTAAGVVDLTGVGLVASTAMKGVATGVATAQTVAEQIIDRGEGEKARALLDRAQAGDGHARSELFRYHPRYAKGILAVMASEGDALALRVLNTHGLTEAMISRSSPKIIKRYLLAKFGESDEPASWTSAYESFNAGVAKAAALFRSVGDFFDDKANWITVSTSSDSMKTAQAALMRLAYGLSTQADVSAAVAALNELRLKRDSLAATADAEQAKSLAAADKAIEDEQTKVGEVRKKVMDSMVRLRDVMATLASKPPSPERKAAQDAGKSALREHLVRIERLAQAA